ncbi:MAG: hypothetical protein HYX80_00265 [Chloroflexi bacterium]|nr:hypothetical protein [Chloroflexota bacterium]
MKSFLIYTNAGPVLILSKFDSVKHPELACKLAAYGKFMAYEIPLESVKASYTPHFEHVLEDHRQTDEFRVLDVDGKRIFNNISFEQLGPPAFYEPEAQPLAAKAEAK